MGTVLFVFSFTVYSKITDFPNQFRSFLLNLSVWSCSSFAVQLGSFVTICVPFGYLDTQRLIFIIIYLGGMWNLTVVLRVRAIWKGILRKVWLLWNVIPCIVFHSLILSTPFPLSPRSLPISLLSGLFFRISFSTEMFSYTLIAFECLSVVPGSLKAVWWFFSLKGIVHNWYILTTNVLES